MVPAAALAIAGQAAATIQVQPQNSSYFKPYAIAMTVTDAADPGLDRRARVYAASIQGCPQLGVRNTAPTIASTDFFYNDQWDPRNRDGCACPISWGTFSNLSNSFPLEITVLNPHPVGIDIDVSVTLFGLPCHAAPECGCGRDVGGMPPVPPTRPAPRMQATPTNWPTPQ
jgi:hypothetical protein